MVIHRYYSHTHYYIRPNCCVESEFSVSACLSRRLISSCPISSLCRESPVHCRCILSFYTLLRDLEVLHERHSRGCTVSASGENACSLFTRVDELFHTCRINQCALPYVTKRQ
jgi:hypothetical protein